MPYNDLLVPRSPGPRARGQVVHRVGPELAYALCPACLTKGNHSVLEIRKAPEGVDVDEHEGWRG